MGNKAPHDTGSSMLLFFGRQLRNGLLGLIMIISPLAIANVQIIGAPVAASTLRLWGNQFTRDTNIAVAYVEALEDVATAELFVGVYDLAIVEYPLTTSRLTEKGLIQFPLLAVPVVVVVNLPGIASNTISLNAPVLAAIFQGEINSWNDRRIAEINPGVSLPSIPVVPIAQSDGAGATFNFTRYLAGGSEKWRAKIGLGSGLIWPLGPGEKDSASAAQKLLSQEGGIGFQSWGNANRLGLTTIKLQNAHGDFVSPAPDRFVYTLKAFLAKDGEDFVAPVNIGGADSWPILSVVYGQMKRIPEDVPDALETVQMLTRALKANLPVTDGMVPVSYQNVAPTINQVQPTKSFGPPSKTRGGL